MRPRTSVTGRTERALVLLAALLLVLLTPGVASAEPPAEVTDRVTDQLGVLGPSASAVERSVASLEAETGIVLHAVFVQSFRTLVGQDWAEQTALRSGLGETDVLLAVAVQGDGTYEYTWWSGESFPLSDDEVGQLLTDELEPPMNAGYWASGVAAFSAGLEAELVDAGIDTSTSVAPAPWSRNTTLTIPGVVAAVLLVAHLLSRRSAAASPG